MIPPKDKSKSDFHLTWERSLLEYRQESHCHDSRNNWMWWLMSVIPVLGSLQQEGHEFVGQQTTCKDSVLKREQEENSMTERTQAFREIIGVLGLHQGLPKKPGQWVISSSDRLI